VALGSFTHGALAELSPHDLDRMLDLDETLFVEHKSDLGKDTAHEVTVPWPRSPTPSAVGC
jgi:hypothetical protein